MPRSLWDYSDICFTTFKNEASRLLTTEIDSTLGKHHILCNGIAVPFDITTYEFKRADIAVALGADKITEDQMHAFSKAVYLAAKSISGNLRANLTTVDLDNLRNSYSVQTGINLEISKNKYHHYTLSYCLPRNDEVYYLENCKDVGFGEAFGAISRAIAQYNQQPQVKTMIDLDNELSNFCAATNSHMRPRGWKLDYKVIQKDRPGVYSFEISASAKIMDKDFKTKDQPDEPAGVDEPINMLTSDPSMPTHEAAYLDQQIDYIYAKNNPSPKPPRYTIPL